VHRPFGGRPGAQTDRTCPPNRWFLPNPQETPSPVPYLRITATHEDRRRPEQGCSWMDVSKCLIVAGGSDGVGSKRPRLTGWPPTVWPASSTTWALPRRIHQRCPRPVKRDGRRRVRSGPLFRNRPPTRSIHPCQTLRRSQPRSHPPLRLLPWHLQLRFLPRRVPLALLPWRPRYQPRQFPCPRTAAVTDHRRRPS
jgi:hypothetical protein